ncbi:MAG: hypothetical protein KA436_04980 [Oligoflexales bacterium]|nr:hypothetical protein [Oligoflexales bacterium]
MRKILSILIFLGLEASCSYRFSNLHVRVPKGARNLAVEAIYDTGRIPVPHEVFWETLQKEFAIRGHLRLSSVDNADIYVRTLIKDTATRQSDVESSLKKYTAKEIVNENEQRAYFPGEFIDMNSADQYSKREHLSFSVELEVWDLRSNQKILSKTYPMVGQHNILESISTPENRFLRLDEKYNALFSSLSKTVSQSIVNDFYSLDLP